MFHRFVLHLCIKHHAKKVWPHLGAPCHALSQWPDTQRQCIGLHCPSQKPLWLLGNFHWVFNRNSRSSNDMNDMKSLDEGSIFGAFASLVLASDLNDRLRQAWNNNMAIYCSEMDSGWSSLMAFASMIWLILSLTLCSIDFECLCQLWPSFLLANIFLVVFAWQLATKNPKYLGNWSHRDKQERYGKVVRHTSFSRICYWNGRQWLSSLRRIAILLQLSIARAHSGRLRVWDPHKEYHCEHEGCDKSLGWHRVHTDQILSK